MPKGKKEDTLTVFLIQELKLQGLDADTQVRLRGKGKGWADALVKVRNQPVIIEAKHGQESQDQEKALEDCRKRLKNGHCTAAVAVCYPLGVSDQPTFLESTLLYSLLDADQQNPPWLSGTPRELGNALKMAPAQMGNADIAANELRGELDKVLANLSPAQKESLAQALDLPPTPQPKRGNLKAAEYAPRLAHWEKAKYDTAAIRGCLVIASAMMFHARLDSYLKPEDKPVYDAREPETTPYAGPWPPAPLSHCKDAADIVAALTRAWDIILALDYKPVFQTAIAGLKAPADDRNWRDGLRLIADAAGNLASDLAGGRQDVMGRIFHRVLDTAPYDGSFYTGTAGATLLATLAIRPEDRDWQDLDAIAGVNVTDPACGTGTLPIAAATRIRELAAGVDQEQLSAILVEKVLHLYDINLTATHMAATTLGLMSPTTQFSNMNVHRTRLGPPLIAEGKPVLPAQVGSLEWLESKPMLVKWPEYKASEQIETQLEKAPRLAPADLFIMNPPFARDSLRYDQFTAAEEKAIKSKEEELLKDTVAHRSGGTHAFTVLAQRHLKAAGRIASIYPIAMAQAKSALPIRQFLGKDMHVEYVVALKDPQGMAFSENTNIGEMLVIARPWQKDEVRATAETIFVKILSKPPTPVQAKAMGEAILRGENSPDYRITPWPQSRMDEGDWFPTQFVRAELLETYQGIIAGKWFPVRTGKAAGEQGPRDFISAFVTKDESTLYRALKDHKSDLRRYMAAAPDVYIAPKEGKEKLAEEHWAQRSHSLLPTRLSTPNTRVTAVFSEQAIMGNAFAPYHPEPGRHNRVSVQKALVAYLNSTLGITALLGVTSNKKIVYPNWSVDDRYLIPFPDWGKLPPRQVRTLAAAYDKLCGREFQELRYMLTCDTRKELDAAVAAALRIPAAAMEQARIALASEPAITGKTFTGDALVGGLR